jgi:predicted CDP-diglyceride synthetase/phosphatidate cytidylyltransferase
VYVYVRGGGVLDLGVCLGGVCGDMLMSSVHLQKQAKDRKQHLPFCFKLLFKSINSYLLMN